MAVCASCGAENRDGARFCDSCGAPLAEAAPVREMRKVVTVLFCDVTGSTALGERIDPESLRRVMSRYFETAYNRRPKRTTRNANDFVFAQGGKRSLLPIRRSGGAYVASIALGVHRS